ncbi:MAG: hypothetical protein ACN2B6_04415 [Rickettsiales bacterium]
MLSFKKGKGDQSPGEVLFDRTVYTGIGFGVNEALSLYLADEIQHGFLKKQYDQFGNFLVKKLNVGEVVKNGVTHSAKARVDNTLVVGALLIGGTLLLAPMKWIEDNKAYWVKKGNHFLDKVKGSKLTPEQVEQRDKEVAHDIACEPKQTWPTLLLGRLAGILTNMFVLSIFVFPKPTAEKIEVKSEAAVNKATRGLNKILGGKENSLLSKMQRTERYPRYAKLLGIETVYTLSTSVILEVVSKLSARTNHNVHDPELCEEAKAEEQLAECKASAKKCSAINKKTANTKFVDKVSRRSKPEAQNSYAEGIAIESDQQLQPGI